MKVILTSVILAVGIFSTLACSEEILQISIPDIKNEILQLQGLEETKDAGIFRVILDDMFFWFSDDINARKHIFEKTGSIAENDEVFNSEIAIVLLRDKNGVLKKVIYRNNFLFPLEEKEIEIDFSSANFTSVRIKFITFYNNIKKDIVLTFNKGETISFDKTPNCFYWGQIKVSNLKNEFDIIKEKIINQNYISSKTKSFGFLGQFLDSMLTFKQKIVNEDIFVIKSQRIENVFLQDLRADCFFIGSNISLVVTYDGKGDIVSAYKIMRRNVLEFQDVRFGIDGLKIVTGKYNPISLRLGELKRCIIPYTKTESELVH